MKLLRIFLFISTTVALQAAPFFAPDGWLLGTEFPSPPKVSPPKAVGEAVQTIAICENAAGSFIAVRGELPAEMPKEGIAATYDLGRDAMLKSMSADLLREEKIMIGGHEGRRYLIEAKSKKAKGENRVVLIGKELYQFSFVTKAESIYQPGVAAFFSKIRVTDKKD